MRIERIEIAGFGGLRDASVDFHPRLTVVLGDNESGKSTLHRAVRAALFGIDAGGQGRAVERSAWMRWMPWTPGPYGVALTYTLEDGRRIRVARRLDIREQPVQVLELGGSDLTDELRSGRVVTPGRFHLGVDEAVFCATAWLGDDGLALGSAEGPAERAANLQEAIERLADTRSSVTAGEAVTRLRQALQRIGTERRSTSPLGAASLRLRELTVRLEAAQRRTAAVAAEQQRLRELETAADAAEGRRLLAERSWLRGRIAHITARLGHVRAAAAETAALAATLAETAAYASFPTAAEGAATSLGGELNQAGLAAGEAEARWQAAQEQLQPLRRRRAEIGAGLRAMPVTPDAGSGVAETAVRLEGELAALEAACTAAHGDAAVDARVSALRREIAATGLGTLPPGAAAPLADLLHRESHGAAMAWWYAAAVALGGAAAAGALLAARVHRPVLAAAAVPVLLVAAALAVLARSRGRRAAAAARQLEEVALRLGIDADAEWLRIRLPALEALQQALRQEQARVESRRGEWEALHATAAALAERCASLAGRASAAPAARAPAVTTEVLLQQARESLARLRRTVAVQQRRTELEHEDVELQRREQAIAHLEEEAAHRRASLAVLQERLEQLMASVGMQPRLSAAESVAAVREACEARRRHDAAAVALEEVRRCTAALGSEVELRRSLGQWTRELAKRGDSADVSVDEPLGSAALQQLEEAAEHARQSAQVAREQAREVRVHLAAVLDGIPDLADLEDDRHACAAEVAVAQRRRDAVLRAIELIEQASRRTHRDLAPQLAESLASRLALLTGDRYQAVNVDTEHFAVSLLGHDRPDMVALDVASHGTRDQVALLLRIALCETLGSTSEPAPLLLDEPLVTADPHRRDLMLRFLHELSATHQIVVTAVDDAIAASLRAIAGDDVAVVTLAEREPIVEATGRRSRRVRVMPALNA